MLYAWLNDLSHFNSHSSSNRKVGILILIFKEETEALKIEVVYSY